jgi:hypothetical protein
MKQINWTGKKLHKLTFIRERPDKKYRSNIVWEALCECGKTTYVIPSRVSGGKTKSCGCYRINNCTKYLKHKRLYDPVITSARRAYASYKRRDNNICNFETFYRLSQQPCYYCNRDPYNVYNCATITNYNSDDGYQAKYGNFIYNGIDRIDSSKQHTLDNIVTCCYECNQAKNDLTISNFYNLIKMIYRKKIKNY